MITIEERTIQEMKTIYEWKEATTNLYQRAIHTYTEYNQLTLDELIIEAETDEETITKPKRRKIYNRLIGYRIHLQEQEYKPNTIKNYITKIVKVYRYCDITVPELPPVRNNIVETYNDLPTIDEICNAINHSRTKMKALITFIASSGLRRSDVACLTIQDFIDATKEYHKSYHLLDVLCELSEQDTIIPTWHINSVKTGTTHITFSSPESTNYIIQHLREVYMKKELHPEDTIFQMKKDSISKNFRNLNDRLGYGWKETRRKFHPHSLRKYFATTLTSNNVPYLDTQFLVGHSIPSVDSSYYFCNADKLKNKYVHVVDYLSFVQKVSYVDMSLEDRTELEELKRYKLESARKISKLEEMVNYLTKDL